MSAIHSVAALRCFWFSAITWAGLLPVCETRAKNVARELLLLVLLWFPFWPNLLQFHHFSFSVVIEPHLMDAASHGTRQHLPFRIVSVSVKVSLRLDFQARAEWGIACSRYDLTGCCWVGVLFPVSVRG